MNRTFATRTILSVTTGRLLTKGHGPRDNGISDMYDLLGHMTNDTPFTHQLGRFAEECKPWLLRWFPALANVDAEMIAELDKSVAEHGPESGVESWLRYASDLMHLPAVLEVGQIPRDDHDHKHPYDELVEMRGSDEGVIVVDATK